MSTFRELLGRVTPGPWVNERADIGGYRYFLGRKHGWAVAHICNKEEADANAQYIARLNPEVMRQVVDALEHTYTMLDALKESSPEMHAHYKLMGKRYTEEVIGPALSALNGPGPKEQTP